MFTKFFNRNWQIILILLLAFALRIVFIDRTPPSLNWDEVSHGYNAYSILTTGKDEWGKIFPIIFRAYGDYKLPVYIYLTAVSEFVFGLTTLAVRLPSILAGTGTVLFTYLLTKELFVKSKSDLLKSNFKLIATLAALLIAVEPWDLFLSRGAFEANVALFLIVAGVYFFLKGIEAPKLFIPSSILFGFSIWTYNSARIFVPLLISVLILLFKKEIYRLFKEYRKLTSYIIILTSIFFLPMFWQLFQSEGQARYSRVAIIDDGAIGQIIEQREKSNFSPAIGRLIFNRYTFFAGRFVENYISHFSPGFMFLNGGTNYQFSIPGHGLLDLLNLPFFYLGLTLLLKKAVKRDSNSLLILSWIILAPIPGSLTREAPHVLRSITMLPIPMIVSAFGLVSFVEWSAKFLGKTMRLPTSPSDVKIFINRKNALYLVYILTTAVFINNYLKIYFGEYRTAYSWSWQYGYRQVVDYAKAHFANYDKIIITKKYGEPHEFFLYYLEWDSKKYNADPNLIRFYQSNWYWVDRFDKFYFVNDWTIPKEEWEKFSLESGEKFDCNEQKCLLVTDPGNAPKRWSLLTTVSFLDGKKAFEIYEN